MADGNGTNAEVRFLTASSSDYFWDDVSMAGRLFQGWIQNPGEGRLDYRGSAH